MLFNEVCGGPMDTGLTVFGGGDSWEHGGVARAGLGLPEMSISNFGETKSKNFKKGTDLRLRIGGGSSDRTIYSRGRDDALLNMDKTPKALDRASIEAI
jgi:hypothetical protein